jgi:hypothetical protein
LLPQPEAPKLIDGGDWKSQRGNNTVLLDTLFMSILTFVGVVVSVAVALRIYFKWVKGPEEVVGYELVTTQPDTPLLEAQPVGVETQGGFNEKAGPTELPELQDSDAAQEKPAEGPPPEKKKRKRGQRGGKNNKRKDDAEDAQPGQSNSRDLQEDGDMDRLIVSENKLGNSPTRPF